MTSVPNAHSHAGDILRRFFAIWSTLIVLSGIPAWFVFQTRADAHRSELESSERQKAGIAAQVIASALTGIGSDLSYLADQPSLRHWLDTGREDDLQQLAHEYLAFTLHRGLYDQVRYIDAEGHELVRVNWNAGQPMVVPHNQLQNKSSRYYVREALKLPAGSLYISRFDLNVEHGAIERPFKPMLRVATPIVGRQGHKRGLVVLNVLGQRILQALSELSGHGVGQFWLTNQDGYWLKGPRAADEWGFMFPGRSKLTLAVQYPDVWANMNKQAATGQDAGEAGLFTFRSIDPAKAVAGGWLTAANIDSARHWFVVRYLPSHVVSAYPAVLAQEFTWGYGVLTLVFAVGAWLLAHFSVQRAQAQRAAHHARGRYQGLVNNLSTGIYRATAGPKGRFLEVNPAMVKLFAADTREQLLNVPVRNLYVDRRQRAPFSEGAKGPNPVVNAELQLRRLDGHRFWASVAAVLRTDASGAKFFDGVLTDITERKRAEQALRASEARFRALLGAAPDAVVITDAQGAIVMVNQQVQALFGYGSEELVGQRVEVLVPERYRASHAVHRTGYVQEPRTRPMGVGLDLWGCRKDGSEFPVAISLSPVRTDDGLLVYADIRDVTARRQAQNQIQALNAELVSQNRELEVVNKELEAFSYSVSHDLRAPLRAIDGFSRILEDHLRDQLSETAKDHLSRVRRAAQHMGRLIDDLLMLSRVTRADLVREPVNLSQIAAEICDTLHQTNPDRELTFCIAEDCYVHGDPRLLKIAMDNLLGNAWKFTGAQECAQIEFSCSTQDGEMVYRIADNGAGFDMAYADHLFGAFQRLHDAHEYPGTGIGLATVQRIIHKHGGRIWANAEIDRGATFFFTLGSGKEQP